MIESKRLVAKFLMYPDRDDNWFLQLNEYFMYKTALTRQEKKFTHWGDNFIYLVTAGEVE